MQADIKWMALKRGDYIDRWDSNESKGLNIQLSLSSVESPSAYVVAKERNFCTKAKSIFIQFSRTASASKAGAPFKMTEKNKLLYFPVNQKVNYWKSHIKANNGKKYEEIWTFSYLYFLFLSILPLMAANDCLELGREYSSILYLTYAAVLFSHISYSQ